MPGRRNAEDYLRSEYVRLLPALQRTSVAIETKVRHRLLTLTLELDPYERVIVKSRIKDCESAIDALRRRQPYGFFDPDRAEEYSLTNLPDLLGVRVLAFPPRRLNGVRDALLPRLRTWAADHMPASNPEAGNIGLKYSGRWHDNDTFRSEIQIVSLLIGLFWEVEHAAVYKPSPNLRGIMRSVEMKQRVAAVESALSAFEDEFGRILDDATQAF